MNPKHQTILHTEASTGWGGQEIRIFQEACGMRERGHTVLFAVQKGAILAAKARAAGFTTYEVSFAKSSCLKTLWSLFGIIRRHQVAIVNTHSSLDAWIGGFAAKSLGHFVIRTRHLSTPIRKGLNSKLLYKWLADHVVTTSKETEEKVRAQAHLPQERVCTIATGIDPRKVVIDREKVRQFRQKHGIHESACLIGMLCVIRGWKGISDFLHAAKELSSDPTLRWIVVGGGVSEAHFLQERKELGLEERVIFTGHLEDPYTALAAMDLFVLLSWAHEGISQATLQAAFLKKPLITTATGGLKEVCIDQVTGFQVPAHSPHAVAEAVLRLAKNGPLCMQMGEAGHKLVLEKFSYEKMLEEMERVYDKRP